jgi:hypothetical protein
MKWFYNKEKQGVIAEKQPKGYHYDFRGKNLSCAIVSEQSEQELKDAIEFEEVKKRYMQHFGKKPNGRAKKETLIKALADDC